MPKPKSHAQFRSNVNPPSTSMLKPGTSKSSGMSISAATTCIPMSISTWIASAAAGGKSPLIQCDRITPSRSTQAISISLISTTLSPVLSRIRSSPSVPNKSQSEVCKIGTVPPSAEIFSRRSFKNPTRTSRTKLPAAANLSPMTGISRLNSSPRIS